MIFPPHICDRFFSVSSAPKFFRCFYFLWGVEKWRTKSSSEKRTLSISKFSIVQLFLTIIACLFCSKPLDILLTYLIINVLYILLHKWQNIKHFAWYFVFMVHFYFMFRLSFLYMSSKDFPDQDLLDPNFYILYYLKLWEICIRQNTYPLSHKTWIGGEKK